MTPQQRQMALDLRAGRRTCLMNDWQRNFVDHLLERDPALPLTEWQAAQLKCTYRALGGFTRAIQLQPVQACA
jgi:hypothetical protein